MKKISTLLATFVFGSVFLVLQMLIIYKFLERSNEIKDVKDRSQPSVQYEAVRLFMSVANLINAPVVLVQPSILSTIMQKRLGNLNGQQRCQFLCTSQNVTTFAGFQKVIFSMEDLIHSLENHGFTVFKTEGPHPVSLQQSTTPDPVPYHYILLYRDHVIHLALLYERSDLYLWKGPLELPASIKQRRIYLQNHTFANRYAAAIKKSETTEIKIDGVLLKVPKRPNQFLKNIRDARFLECNYQQARDYHTVYPKDESPVAIDFKSRAIQLVTQGQRILDELGIPFWMSSGTCLGWFRECDIIPHSQDVDFGIWAADYKPNIINAFEMNNWVLKHILGKVEDSFELSFIHENGLKLDLFFFYEEFDHVWNGGTDVYTAVKYKYSFPKFHLCWTEFQSMLIRVPCETQSYIEANYGRSWRKKVEDWDWKSSPPNIRENGRWHEEDFQEAIQVF